MDSSGLQTLLLNCSELRHINLSGVHLHADDFAHSSFSSLCHLLAINSSKISFFSHVYGVLV